MHTLSTTRPFSTSILSISRWHPATIMWLRCFPTKLVQRKSLVESSLQILRYSISACQPNSLYMPYRHSTSRREMDTCRSHRNDTALMEEQLLDRPIRRGMASIGGVSSKLISMKGRDSALSSYITTARPNPSLRYSRTRCLSIIALAEYRKLGHSQELVDPEAWGAEW